MASRGRRIGAGERVLESKHVIGLFLLMLVFSGIFFTLGYVMGRNQFDGQVRAEAIVPRPRSQAAAPSKTDSAAKRANSVPADPNPPSDITAQPSSEWSFYNAGKPAPAEDIIDPMAPVVGQHTIPAVAKGKNLKSANTPSIPSGAYTLQVAALRREADAQSLASHLQRKKFPAFVAAPQADKYYRVQVGPYSDERSADAARKSLEGAGFKAIVKH